MNCFKILFRLLIETCQNVLKPWIKGEYQRLAGIVCLTRKPKKNADQEVELLLLLQTQHEVLSVMIESQDDWID